MIIIISISNCFFFLYYLQYFRLRWRTSTRIQFVSPALRSAGRASTHRRVRLCLIQRVGKLEGIFCTFYKCQRCCLIDGAREGIRLQISAWLFVHDSVFIWTCSGDKKEGLVNLHVSVVLRVSYAFPLGRFSTQPCVGLRITAPPQIPSLKRYRHGTGPISNDKMCSGLPML